MTIYSDTAQADHIQGKRMWLAALLAFLFGPLGMLYTTDRGALIMLILHLSLAWYSQGQSYLWTLGLCVAWTVYACWRHNRQLRATISSVPSCRVLCKYYPNCIVSHPTDDPCLRNQLSHKLMNHYE